MLQMYNSAEGLVVLAPAILAQCYRRAALDQRLCDDA